LALAGAGAQESEHYGRSAKSAAAVVAESTGNPRYCRGPGRVQTDMLNCTKTDAGWGYALGTQAWKRIAEPDDISGVAISRTRVTQFEARADVPC
jgi:hypothetical protein